MVIFHLSFWITFTERVVHSLGDLHGGVLLTARGLRLRRIRIDEGPCEYYPLVMSIGRLEDESKWWRGWDCLPRDVRWFAVEVWCLGYPRLLCFLSR